MKTWALGWLGTAILAILAGCGNTSVELSNLNKTVQDLKQHMTALTQAHGELAATVDQLRDSQMAAAVEYGDLKRVGENLKNSLEQKDNEYIGLAEALEQLKGSQDRLASLTTRLATEMTRRGTESSGGRIGTTETPRIVESERPSASSESKERAGLRVNAEGCEAVDNYIKLLNKVTRSSYGTAQESQMDDALAELKQVMAKFAGQGDSARILSLAEEAKWYARNASKSRTYIAGGPGWANLLNENKKNLMEICSRQ